MVKVRNIAKIISKLDVKDDVKALISALKLVFYLLIYLHIKACLLFYVTNLDKLYTPPFMWTYPNDFYLIPILFEMKGDLSY